MQKKTKKTLIITSSIALLMFAISFAIAPLYNSLCRAKGINGRMNLVAYDKTQKEKPGLSHFVDMQFVTTLNNQLPVELFPEKVNLKISTGTPTKTYFYIKNLTSKILILQAIPSITPWQAAPHLHKIECFCFQKQTLLPGESRKMPLVFQLDKELPETI